MKTPTENQSHESPNPPAAKGCAVFAAWLHDYFRELRFNPHHHVGAGDVRLTLGQQDDLVVAAASGLCAECLLTEAARHEWDHNHFQ